MESLKSCLPTMHLSCDSVGSKVDGARPVTLVSIEHRHYYHIETFKGFLLAIDKVEGISMYQSKYYLKFIICKVLRI